MLDGVVPTPLHVLDTILQCVSSHDVLDTLFRTVKSMSYLCAFSDSTHSTSAHPFAKELIDETSVHASPATSLGTRFR